MIIVEFILYILVLSLFFLSKHIKKFFGLDKKSVKLKNEYPFNNRNNNVFASKPRWKLKVHYGFFIFLFIFVMISLPVLITYVWSVLQSEFVFTNVTAIYIGSEVGITFLPALFISIPISNLIFESLPFQNARYAMVHFYNRTTLPRKLDIFLTKCLFIIFFAISFPFIILNTDYYIAVNNDYIDVHRYFSFKELSYSISDDIEYTDVTYTSKDDFYYTVHTFDGNNIDLQFNFPQKERNNDLYEIFMNNNVEVIDRYKQSNTDSQ